MSPKLAHGHFAAPLEVVASEAASPDTPEAASPVTTYYAEHVDDVRDDLEFYGDVWFYKVYAEFFVPEYPANFARWEFVRLVNNLPFEDYYVYDGPHPMPPGAISKTFFSTYQRAELEVAAGGRVSQNIGYIYSLSDEDRVSNALGDKVGLESRAVTEIVAQELVYL